MDETAPRTIARQTGTDLTTLCIRSNTHDLRRFGVYEKHSLIISPDHGLLDPCLIYEIADGAARRKLDMAASERQPKTKLNIPRICRRRNTSDSGRHTNIARREPKVRMV
jgi:hypothetical protein